jgi:hypothetical protein
LVKLIPVAYPIKLFYPILVIKFVCLLYIEKKIDNKMTKFKIKIKSFNGSATVANPIKTFLFFAAKLGHFTISDFYLYVTKYMN